MKRDGANGMNDNGGVTISCEWVFSEKRMGQQINPNNNNSNNYNNNQQSSKRFRIGIAVVVVVSRSNNTRVFPGTEQRRRR